MRSLCAVAVVSVSMMGCASTSTSETVRPPATAEERGLPLTPERPPFNARDWASKFDRPSTCEQAAEALHKTNASQGWDGLKACVNKGGFWDLRAVASGEFVEDLRTRPDAPVLLMRIVAMRAGDPENDLDILQKQKIPVFRLADALGSPETYRGLTVMMRAQVTEVRTEGGKPTVHLEEHRHGMKDAYVEVGSAYSITNRSNGPDGRNRNQTRYGHVERRSMDLDIETGREALAVMDKPDPFLVPEKDFIVLARFEGVKHSSEGEGDDDAPIAVMSILSYARPDGIPMY